MESVNQDESTRESVMAFFGKYGHDRKQQKEKEIKLADLQATSIKFSTQLRKRKRKNKKQNTRSYWFLDKQNSWDCFLIRKFFEDL